jgi:4-methylaminobutanoate oxidase (formaldehyde-forming)
MDNTDTPLEAGLSFVVDFDKPGGFVGREALLRKKEEGAPERRLVQFLLQDPEPLLYHAEPVYRNGARVGHIQSGGYGFTLGGAVGLGYVENEGGASQDFIETGQYEIQVVDERYPAAASLRPMYDPKGEKIRA